MSRLEELTRPLRSTRFRPPSVSRKLVPSSKGSTYVPRLQIPLDFPLFDRFVRLGRKTQNSESVAEFSSFSLGVVEMLEV